MKKRKRIIIISCIILFLIISYFLGGIIASNIVLNNIFDKRGSDLSSLLNVEERIYKTRNDYDILKERTEYYFYNNYNEKLVGYYYKTNDSKGLVISAHGMTSQADSFDAEYQSYFVENGYNLFSFDLTASGKSEGNSMRGLHQSAYDVYSAYTFLKANNLLENNLILVGHSWGAYGVATSLSLGVKANYLITFSAFDNPYDTYIRYSKNYMGDFINLTIPSFFISTEIKYGKNNRLSASQAIKDSKIKSLIIHGNNDNSIPYDNEALYNHVKDYNNCETLLLDGINHNRPWLSKESKEYVNDNINNKIKELKDNELDTFINNIDKNKTTELSNIVFNKINNFLN